MRDVSSTKVLLRSSLTRKGYSAYAIIPLFPTDPERKSCGSANRSHRLMLRAGMVHQSSAGIYSWLPLGLRVLKNIERIVRDEQNAIGCHEMLMPTIQPAEL